MNPGQPVNPDWKADWFQISWEREKLEQKIPTDTIYIHHTGTTAGITARQLSDFHRSRLYLPRYQSDNKDPFVKGQKPYSGHFKMSNGILTEVFYAYHALVRMNGEIEFLLRDSEVGWHCGNWHENMRSLAICFDGDFSKDSPWMPMIEAAARLINSYVFSKKFAITRLRAHYDANPSKQSPGKWFDRELKEGLTGREYLMKLARVELDRN